MPPRGFLAIQISRKFGSISSAQNARSLCYCRSATKRATLFMLQDMKDKGSYLMQTLPPLYKCTHVKRKKMVAGTFWPSLVLGFT